MRKARVGFHNDSVFTGDEEEQNTFFYCNSDNAAFVKNQIDWQHQDALFVPQGGETGCPYDPEYGNCDNAILRLAERRFDVLNRGWCTETLQAWRDGGCYDEIAAKLGYRIRLISATLAQTTIKPGSTFNLQIKLINDGYGKIYNKRDFEVVLKHKSTGGEHFLPFSDHDPRFWLPGEIQDIEFTTDIPATGMLDGEYDVFVFLPDPHPALRNVRIVNRFGDPAVLYWSPYAIRLANEGVWDENSGYNDLLLDLTISSITTVNPKQDVSGEMMLMSWPNPFNLSTKLTYSLPNNNFVILKIYDILGREVQTLFNEYLSSGEYFVDFDAPALPNGIYIVKLQVGDKIKTHKLLLMK
jgi:hypothetical protein